MRQIEKGEMPEFLHEWLEQEVPQNRKYKTFPHKSQLRGVLVAEQYGLCAYCLCRIEDSSATTHIEHLRPQHLDRDNSAGTQTDYKNVVASCPGDQDFEGAQQDLEKPEEQLHCGHGKREWYDEALFVNPITSLADRAYTFGLDGSIQIASDLTAAERAAAEESMKRLRLDSSLLHGSRQAAIQAVLTNLIKRIKGFYDEPTTAQTREVYEAVLDELAQRDDEGRLAPFQPVLVQAIRLKLAHFT